MIEIKQRRNAVTVEEETWLFRGLRYTSLLVTVILAMNANTGWIMLPLLFTIGFYQNLARLETLKELELQVKERKENND